MTQINHKTHKIIMASYHPTQHFFAIPIEWDFNECYVKWGILHYKNEEMLVKHQLCEDEMKRPANLEVVDFNDYSHFLEE